MTTTLEKPELTREARRDRVPVAGGARAVRRRRGRQGSRRDGGARSGEPIEHWYWGKIVHDLAGMRVLGDKVAFDWCHSNWDGCIGYGEKFDVTSGDLVITGTLVAFKDDDRAAEVISKGKRGVPYEASIYYDPLNGLRMEYVPEKMSASVNGRQIEGPCVIVREWLLRGVAICPYGADPHTSTEFSRQREQKINVTLFSTEAAMAKDKPAETKPEETKETKLAADPTAPPAEKPAPRRTRRRGCGPNSPPTSPSSAPKRRQVVRRGEDARRGLRAPHRGPGEPAGRKEKEIAELKTRLSSIDTGEKDPVAFGSGEKKDQPGGSAAESRFAHLGSGMAKFASGIKLPAGTKA